MKDQGSREVITVCCLKLLLENQLIFCDSKFGFAKDTRARHIVAKCL